MSVESLTDEQAMFAMARVGEWLRIKEEQGQRTNSPDATHSSLLHWLLKGNKPLPKPPPVLYSRPCHALASGETIPLHDPPVRYPDGDNVVVAQNKEWQWVDHGQGLLKHVPSDQMYQYDPDAKTLRKVEVQVV